MGCRAWRQLVKMGTRPALDLQLLWAYQLAAELENNLGMKEYAKQYEVAAVQLKQTIQKKYWDPFKKAFCGYARKRRIFPAHKFPRYSNRVVNGTRCKCRLPKK